LSPGKAALSPIITVATINQGCYGRHTLFNLFL
jgi:hypothetical protein